MNTTLTHLTAVELPTLHAELGMALDPQSLEPMAEDAVRELLADGESANTVRSYRSALRYWAAWYVLRYRQRIALPLPVPVVMQFIVDHVRRYNDAGLLVTELPDAMDRLLVDGGFKGSLGPLALSTVLHRVSVLSKLHQSQLQPNPCAETRVRELIARARRAYAKRGDLPEKKPALTREPLEALLDTCDDSLRGRRDCALLLFAWAGGGRRRSEVTAATMENLLPRPGGTYVYLLMHSKTNQAGKDRPDNAKPLVGRAARAMDEWLAASGVQSGAIFRRIRKGDQIGEPLSPAAVRDIVRQRAQLAGLGDDFSAHSLRSGFVTEAVRQQVPLPETMALTGHRSVASLVGYFRAEAKPTRASFLLDDDDAPEKPVNRG
jgi:integrase